MHLRALLASLLVAACGSSPKPAAPTAPTAPIPPAAAPEVGFLDRVDALADDVCACPDAACATGADEALGEALRATPFAQIDAWETPGGRRLASAVDRATGCVIALDLPAGAFSRFAVRGVEHVSAAICACEDAACTLDRHRVMETMIEGAQAARLVPPERDRAALRTAIEAGRACAAEAYTPVVQEMIAKMRALRDAVCACPDLACADAVEAEVAALSIAMDPTIAVREELVAELGALDAAYGACYREVAGR